MNARVGDMLLMLPVTRAHGLEEAETRSVRSAFQSLRERGLQVDTLTELFASSSWFTFMVFQLACLVFSAWLVTHHRLTVGDAVMYHTYFGMLIGAVQQALGVFPALAQGRDAIRSIGEILESPQVERNAGKPAAPAPLRGEIVFEQAGFQYPRGRETALRDVHFPPEGTPFAQLQGSSTAAHRRLIFEELFFLELGLELKRRRMRERAGIGFATTDKVREAIREVLPFHPTTAQKRALGEIVTDMRAPSPMRRLLQGDVGSG